MSAERAASRLAWCLRWAIGMYERQSHSSNDFDSRPTSDLDVGGSSLTEHHLDGRDDHARESDHEKLDVAWGVVQRDAKKPPTAGPSAEDRGHDIGPGAMPGPAKHDIPGRVMQYEIRNGKLMIRFFPGPAGGVRPGMKGYLCGDDGAPYHHFEVEHVDEATAWIFVDNTHIDTWRQYKRVVHNPSNGASKPGAGKPVQKSHDAHTGLDDAGVRAAAAQGIAGSGSELPHLAAIQRSFGSHDVSGVQAHVGGAARAASDALGAHAYATGNDVAFADAPSLFLAAHEAAHVVQQRGGVQLSSAVGEVGDEYEQHADMVAARVVAGESAEDLLSAYSGGAAGDSVQRKDAAAPASTGTPSLVENEYRLMANNQRVGATRIHQALKKDPPETSLIGDLAGGAVGATIGALLDEAVDAAKGVAPPLAKPLISVIGSVVKDKAVSLATEAVKGQFVSKKTDAADNFLEAQILAINTAEHGAVKALHSAVATGSAEAPAALGALQHAVHTQAERAVDIQIAHSAGAWARQDADPSKSGEGVKGDLEVVAAVSPSLAVPLTITDSNWKGINKETERVVQARGNATIGDLGAPLRVELKVLGMRGVNTTWFRVGGGVVQVPTIPSERQLLVYAGYHSNLHFRGPEEEQAACENAAKKFATMLELMPVSSLSF